MAGSDHDDLDDLTACQTTNRLEDALYSLETVASRGACQDSWLVPAMEELTARGFLFEAVNLFAQSCGLMSDRLLAMMATCIATTSPGNVLQS